MPTLQCPQCRQLNPGPHPQTCSACGAALDPRRRVSPTGVRMVAGLAYIEGFLALTFLVMIGAYASQLTDYLLAGGLALIGLVFMVLGAGLWGCRRWAWIGSLVVWTLAIIASLALLPQSSSNFINIFLGVGVIVYLLTPGARQAFQP